MVTGLSNLLQAAASPPATRGSGSATQAIARNASNDAGGKAAPASGNNLPDESRPPEAARLDIERAIERIEELARSSRRGLRFAVDEGSGRTVITVINAATNEIVRQIPADEVLAIARALRAQGGTLVAEQA